MSACGGGLGPHTDPAPDAFVVNSGTTIADMRIEIDKLIESLQTQMGWVNSPSKQAWIRRNSE
jgi:hypothetical protein